MQARRASVTLDESSHDMLSRTGNGSAYLSELIRQRWREWQSAIAFLRANGWEPVDIGVACTRLNGVYDVPVGTRLDQFRRSLGKNMVAGQLEADAMAVVAAEWWTGNRELREQLTATEAEPVGKRRKK